MYKNNQLWNRYFPRSQRISYRHRETPRCPSIYFIDLNHFLLLFLLTITKQKYFSSSPKLFFLLHCLWIYPAPCGSTSVFQELYCYDLLYLGVSKQKSKNKSKISYKFFLGASSGGSFEPRALGGATVVCRDVWWPGGGAIGGLEEMVEQPVDRMMVALLLGCSSGVVGPCDNSLNLSKQFDLVCSILHEYELISKWVEWVQLLKW